MSDEMIKMDKEDYHNIKNILNDVSKCDSDVEDYVFDINVLLDKAEPYEETNNMLNSTIQNIIRLLDHISKYNNQIIIERDIVEIKVLLKIEGNE